MTLEERRIDGPLGSSPYWIDHLVVSNFRSYKGKHVIGPFQRLTGIIGPNGAGKSNLMDAISFVLGVQARHIRGSTLADLIYRRASGKQGDDQDAELPNQAHVSLVLRHIENQDDRIVLTRRILNGGTHSVIQVNDETVSFEEYQRRLTELNILVKARNFLVFQGDVVDVAQKSPEELGRLFEQISGSDSLKEQYETLEAEVRALGAELKHLALQRHRIESQYQDLERQVAEVEEYKSIETQLTEARSRLLVYKLYVNEAWAGQTQVQLEELETAARALQEQEDAAAQDLRNADAELARCRLERQKAEALKEALAARLAELTSRIARAFETVEFGKARRAELEKKRETLAQRHQSYSHQETQIRRELEDIERRLDELQGSLATQQNKATITKKQRTEYERLKQLCAAATANLRASNLSLEYQQRALVVQRDHAKAEVDALEAQHAALAEQLATSQEYLQAHAPEAEHGDADLSQKRAELEKAQHAHQIALENEEKLTAERRELEFSLTRLEAGKRESQHAQKARKMLADLREAFPQRVFGTVAELCRPTNKKYGLAIAAALGRYIECAVVDTFETAKKAIEFLKQRKAGVLEFAAIDAMSELPPDPRLRTLDARLAIDCVEYNPQFSGIYQSILNDAIIVSSLPDAERIAYTELPQTGLRAKVITLDGEKIMKNGNIAIDTSLRSVSLHTERKDAERMTTRLAQIDSSIGNAGRDMRQTVARLSQEVSTLQQLCDTRHARIKHWASRVAECEKEIGALDVALARRKRELEGLEANLASCEEELRQNGDRLRDEEAQAFASLSGEVDLQQLRQAETEAEAVAARCEKEKSALGTRQTRLKFELSRIEAATRNLETVDAIDAELTKASAVLERDTAALATLDAEKQQAENEARTADDHCRDLVKTEKACEADLQRHRAHRREIHKKLLAAQTEIHNLNGESERLLKEATDLIKAALVDGVPLPLARGTMDGYSKLLGLTDPSPESMSDDDTPEIDYDRVLTDKMKESCASRGPIRDVECRLEERIGALAAELAKKTPNLKAQEKHDSTVRDIKELEQKMQKLRHDKDKKEHKFNSIKKERSRRFLRCFHHVQQAIDTIYHQLTKAGEDEDALGGQAFLELSDPTHDQFSSGVLYNVIPPSKRFSDLRRLSGGEKTMAALALLFALQSYHPCLFFILDEIDADLDPINLSALAKYVRDARFQVIIISHSDRVFSQADQLIGVYIDSAKESSETLALDLTPYPKVTISDAGGGSGLSSRRLGTPTRPVSSARRSALTESSSMSSGRL